jgi:Xaa-Pro aminopeptidase
MKAAETIATGLKNLGLMKGNVQDAIAAGAHALFLPHGLGHMLGMDVHDMEGLGQINVGYDSEIQPSKQFGTAYLRMGRRLQPGFVVTNEPGIYFIPELIDQWKSAGMFSEFINYDKVEEYRNFGGIRIEDDILVTPDGCRVLGKPIPKTVAEVEETMKEGLA